MLVYDLKNANLFFPPTLDKSVEINKGNNPNILFEIEGCEFPAGSNVLWFSTNEGPVGQTKVDGGIYTESRLIK